MVRPDNRDALALLRTMIDDGEWVPGSRLPSERALTEKFNVGRSTLRRAFDTLEREGVIWRRVGQGTFLSEVPAERAFENIQKMSENITPVQLLRARLALEPMIAKEAAINATEVDIRSIKEAMTVAERRPHGMNTKSPMINSISLSLIRPRIPSSFQCFHT